MKRSNKNRTYEQKKARYTQLIKQNRQREEAVQEVPEPANPVPRKQARSEPNPNRQLHWAEKLAIAATVTQAFVGVFHVIFPALHF